MNDFETHPAGTADLVKRLLAYEGRDFETTSCYNGLRDEAASTIAELDAALTRANAATAAAYEMAAQKCDYIIKNIEILKPDGETYETPRVQKVARVLVDLARQDIRAFATSDQTAALDKMIAEAVGPLMDALEEISSYDTGATAGLAYTAKMAILAASKKGVV